MSGPDLSEQAAGMLAMLQRPRRRAVGRTCALLLSQGEQMTVDCPGGPVTAWRIGDGPAVLLVHGWEDDTSLWTPLVSDLIARGRAVVALDLPGHGASEGERCDNALASGAILAVVAALGPVDAAVGHSFGGPALCTALGQGLALDAVCLIAPPVDQAQQFRRAAARHGVPEALIEAAFEARDGGWLDMAALAPAMTTPALFIHSLDDEQCPAADARRAADAWPGARFLPFDGLGHRLVAQDADVRAMVMAWVG